MENILLNPITLSRIIFKYGSIDNFLANPSTPIDGELEQNFEWMRTVTKEESHNTSKNLTNWAKEGKIPKGGQLGEWIFNKEIVQTKSAPQPNYLISKTPNAAQRIIFFNDKPNEYPSTPKSIEGNPLSTYYKNLKEGAPFFRNHNGEYVVVRSGFSKDKQSIYVLTRSNYVYREKEDGEHMAIPISELQEKVSIKDLPHSLTEVTYEDDLFVHSKVETGFHPREELEEIFTENTQS